MGKAVPRSEMSKADYSSDLKLIRTRKVSLISNDGAITAYWVWRDEGLNAARVVVEVGTHSAWVREVIAVTGTKWWWPNPRLMEGSKRRKREE